MSKYTHHWLTVFNKMRSPWTRLEWSNLIEANLEGADTIDANFEDSLLCQLNLMPVRPAGYPIDRVDIHCVGALLWNTVMPNGRFVAEPEYDTRC